MVRFTFSLTSRSTLGPTKGTGSALPKVKWHWPPPPCADTKNEWSYPPHKPSRFARGQLWICFLQFYRNFFLIHTEIQCVKWVRDEYTRKHRSTLVHHSNPVVKPLPLYNHQERRLKRRWTFDAISWGVVAGHTYGPPCKWQLISL